MDYSSWGRPSGSANGSSSQPSILTLPVSDSMAAANTPATPAKQPAMNTQILFIPLSLGSWSVIDVLPDCFQHRDGDKDDRTPIHTRGPFISRTFGQSAKRTQSAGGRRHLFHGQNRHKYCQRIRPPCWVLKRERGGVVPPRVLVAGVFRASIMPLAFRAAPLATGRTLPGQARSWC